MILSRRAFLASAQAAALFYSTAAIGGGRASDPARRSPPLRPDPAGLLDLPDGFSYRLVSTAGEPMADGFIRPGRPDGMACFPHPDGPDKCILLRNHENFPDTDGGSPFGPDEALLSRLEESLLYDRKADGRPFTGGVTKVVYDLRAGRLEHDLLVLAGTTGNCAGGPTPWGSWLTCEEAPILPANGARRPHGFVFEVPAAAASPVAPVPLTAMGRFAHEAAAVDPDSGIVYLTEDSRTGLFYRFLPAEPGRLARGGRLQALAIRGWPSANTSNWPADWGGPGLDRIGQGQSFDTDWIDLDEVESPQGDLAARGHAAGAAQFCRGEGMAYARLPGRGPGEIFFTCTQGGSQRAGQVWRYRPAAAGPRSAGQLTLVYESPGADTLDMCDNLAAAPWGDLILCEDGLGDQFLRGLTPDGRIYELARNAHAGRSEFCGACFSPDGRTMFVNVQEPGFTFAITGPWERMRG